MHVKVEQVVVKTEKSYVLTLTQDEAQFLMDLTQMIGGDACRSRRQYSDRLANELYRAGLRHQSKWINGDYRLGDVDPKQSSIYFTP